MIAGNVVDRFQPFSTIGQGEITINRCVMHIQI